METKSGPDPATLTLTIGAGEYVFKPLTPEDLEILKPHFDAFLSILFTSPLLGPRAGVPSAFEHITAILKTINPLLAETPADLAAWSPAHSQELLNFWREHTPVN